MKCCQIVDQLKGGGQERVAVTLANALVQRCSDSCLLATRRGGDYEANAAPGVDILIAHRRSILDLKAWLPVGRWMREKRFSVLHAHTPGSLFYAVMCRAFARLDAIVVLHLQMYPPRGTLWRWLAIGIIGLMRPWVDGAIVTNQGLAASLRRLRYDPNRIAVVSNPTVFPFACPSRTKRAALPVVAMVAQWRPQKDHLTAIRAIHILRQQGCFVQLWLIGAEEDLALVSAAKTEIADLGLHEVVRIMGRRTDVGSLLQEASLGLLSTHFEGQPVAVMEYAAAGLPVVVSRVEGTEELISEEGGILGFAAGNAIELSQKIVFVLENNSDNSFGRKAYQSMKQRADLNFVTSEICRLYSQWSEPVQ